MIQRRVQIPAAETDDETLRQLIYLGEGVGRPILITADDAACVFVDDHADLLDQHFLLPRQPAGLVRALSSKRGNTFS